MSRTVSRMSQVDMLRYKPGELTPRPMETSALTTCRRSTANVLTSHRMTLLNLFLILIDILAVVGEITLAYVCECPTLDAPGGTSPAHGHRALGLETTPAAPMTARQRGLRGIAAAIALMCGAGTGWLGAQMNTPTNHDALYANAFSVLSETETLFEDGS